MSATEYELDGHVSMGKTRRGDERVIYHLDLNGRTVYRIQRVLRERAVAEEDYRELREIVFAEDDLRRAIVRFREGEESPGGAGGE